MVMFMIFLLSIYSYLNYNMIYTYYNLKDDDTESEEYIEYDTEKINEEIQEGLDDIESKKVSQEYTEDESQEDTEGEIEDETEVESEEDTEDESEETEETEVESEEETEVESEETEVESEETEVESEEDTEDTEGEIEDESEVESEEDTEGEIEGEIEDETEETEVEKNIAKLFDKYFKEPFERQKTIIKMDKFKKLYETIYNTPLKLKNNEIKIIIQNHYDRFTTHIRVSASMCRDMSKCFEHGDIIRHVEPITRNCWMSTYIKDKNALLYKDTYYPTPSSLTRDHYSKMRPDRTNRSNGWKECELFRNNKWISIYNL